jgi:hypothetical protein
MNVAHCRRQGMFRASAKPLPSRKRGKPKLNDDTKSKRHWRSKRYPAIITSRCSETEYRELAERAANHALSLSRYCIWAGQRSAPPPPPPLPEQTQKLRRLLYELHKLSNNVNQLAHATHSARKRNQPMPTQVDFAGAYDSIQALIDDIRTQL